MYAGSSRAELSVYEDASWQRKRHLFPCPCARVHLLVHVPPQPHMHDAQYLTVLASYTKHPTFLPSSFAGPNKNSTQLFLPLTQSTPLRNLPVLQDLGRRGKSQIAGQISTPQNAQMQTYLFTPQGGLLKRTLGWHGTLGSMKAQGWGYASLGSASLPSCTSLSACQPTTLQKS